MAGKIPQRFIDDLLARVDIVDVINRRVPLKKAGPEYKACCPFHDEKTPSFTVSPTKQFYHCFGCGAHGTAVGFVMDYDRLSFPEAIEALAEHLGLDVPHEAGSDRGPDLAPLYDTLERAARFYARQLRRHPEAGRAVDYLRRRGVSGEIALDFRIGYAPPGWDNLLRDLGRDSAAIDRLRGAGLISEPEGGRRYDRLRDRIVFPILDARGRVVGFGGRVLDGGEPKYLNSPDGDGGGVLQLRAEGRVCLCGLCPYRKDLGSRGLVRLVPLQKGPRIEGRGARGFARLAPRFILDLGLTGVAGLRPF